MKKQRLVLIGCIVVLFGLMFLAPSYGWRFRDLFGPQATGDAQAPSLAAKNEALLAQVATLQSVASAIPTSTAAYLRAMVYSRYPLNFRSEILIDAGANDGVQVGKAVVFQGILVGVVEKVFPDSSLARTVFDTDFKMPVRLGPEGTDGLLAGGADPKVTSIGKGSIVAAGDIVYSAAPGLPYGLPLGIVQATSTSPDDLFEEASIGFAYDANTIQTVLVAK